MTVVTVSVSVFVTISGPLSSKSVLFHRRRKETEGQRIITESDRLGCPPVDLSLRPFTLTSEGQDRNLSCTDFSFTSCHLWQVVLGEETDKSWVYMWEYKFCCYFYCNTKTECHTFIENMFLRRRKRDFTFIH